MLEVFLRKDVEFGIELKKMTPCLNKAHRHRIPPEFLKIRTWAVGHLVGLCCPDEMDSTGTKCRIENGEGQVWLSLY